jgi:hypothetical protein
MTPRLQDMTPGDAPSLKLAETTRWPNVDAGLQGTASGAPPTVPGGKGFRTDRGVMRRSPPPIMDRECASRVDRGAVARWWVRASEMVGTTPSSKVCASLVNLRRFRSCEARFRQWAVAPRTRLAKGPRPGRRQIGPISTAIRAIRRRTAHPARGPVTPDIDASGISDASHQSHFGMHQRADAALTGPVPPHATLVGPGDSTPETQTLRRPGG